MQRCVAAAALFLAGLAGLPSTCCAHSPKPAAAEAGASAKLVQLFKDSDEASLRRNPISALARGDARYAAQFGDYLSPAHFRAERAAAERDLERLKRIDRSSLNPTQQVAYDVFRWQTEQSLRDLSPDILALTAVRPIDHKTSLQVIFPDLSSGRGAAPFKTVEDYRNGLSRIEGFIQYLGQAESRFREGMASHVVQPKLVVDVVTEQFSSLIAQGVDNSPFYMPVSSFPETITPADREALTQAYRQTISGKLLPALVRFRDFLVNEYRPVARDSVGLSQMPGGAKLYRHFVQQHTSLPLEPDDIHALGLREVARIQAAMESVKSRVGFKGSLRDFFDYLRTDPKFKPTSKEQLQQGYIAISKRVDARIPELFSASPRTPLRIEPVPAYREKSASAASYFAGAPDGSRPGTFVFNTSNLPSRQLWNMEALFLHEGVPGHHFQGSLAQENTALPDFMRFGGNTAYQEGWALYAESLGSELGLYQDPYQEFGEYNDEIFRALRLVVDTGIHWKGWSREQAVSYMLANSALSEVEVNSEVNRYIAWPAQALSYKIGQMKIRELRTRAEKALGSRFDVREFHDQVLGTGALPLAVLERKIDRWIASKRA